MKNLKNLILLMFIILAVSLLPAYSQGPARITKETIKQDVEKVVCDNDERLAGVKKLFIEKGAKADEFEIKDFGNVKNFVVTKKGKSSETVVIGAHYDKTPNGCGVIDNWTGIVIIANLYQRMKDLTTNKTYQFVAFGREEEGLIGSRMMVKDIPKAERNNYCAMVNFDSFGFTYPQATGNISSESMIELAEKISKALKIPFGRAKIGGSSDSESFRTEGIPAISYHGLNNNWQRYLHTNRDKTKNVNHASVHIAYLVGLQMLATIDGAGCQDYR